MNTKYEPSESLNDLDGFCSFLGENDLKCKKSAKNDESPIVKSNNVSSAGWNRVKFVALFQNATGISILIDCKIFRYY